MKNTIDAFGNRTRDIPAGSAVPQPTTPPRAPGSYRVIHMSLRDFRPLRYSSRDGHAEGEHVKTEGETLQVSVLP
jgi:hypothetical protein